VCEQLPYGGDVIEEERIREIEFGVLDGLTKAGIRAHYPEEADRKERVGKYWYRPPGGESYPDVALRLHSFLGTLTRDCRGQPVLVVCHSVVVLLFVKLLERLTTEQLMELDRQHEVWTCSLTHYAFDSNVGATGKLVQRCFNTVAYGAELASDSFRRHLAANASA
jgi:broad specificity phosphatase PhoE